MAHREGLDGWTGDAVVGESRAVAEAAGTGPASGDEGGGALNCESRVEVVVGTVAESSKMSRSSAPSSTSMSASSASFSSRVNRRRLAALMFVCCGSARASFQSSVNELNSKSKEPVEQTFDGDPTRRISPPCHSFPDPLSSLSLLLTLDLPILQLLLILLFRTQGRLQGIA